jgi:transcriptional regulator with XRE-family HTH domain
VTEHEVWGRPEVVKALAVHDIATVYRWLQRFGVSQRAIAAASEQSQSEVSEIMKGRQIRSYDVLVRIAEGFSIPRGRMGLEYDEATAALVPDWMESMSGPGRARFAAARMRQSVCSHCLQVTDADGLAGRADMRAAYGIDGAVGMDRSRTQAEGARLFGDHE